ncbi:MAG: hypothetical protein Q4G68_00745 [Planctomycetia bacterium]|nr:hypothetical protein [Planctomycetia bacterium]
MRTRLIYGVVLLAFFAMGCKGAKRPEGMPQLLPVTLVITQDDNVPLSEAQVTLSPVGSGADSGWAVGGTTDESGTAIIYTHGQFAGAPEGTYKVFLKKTKITDPVSYEEAPDDIAGFKRWETEHAAELAAKLAKSKAYNCVEPVYTSVNTTPLEINVNKENSRFELNAGKVVEVEIKEKGR